MRIGTAYNQTATVTNQAAGARLRLTFPSWTALPRGTLSVRCSTELAGDAIAANNKASGSAAVAVKNVGPTRITAPSGACDSGVSVFPACSLHNYGTAAASYTVRMRIGSGYNQTASVSGHEAGTRTYVTFPQWTALPRGAITVACTTELAGDQVTADNKVSGSVLVGVKDVATTRIMAPSGFVDSGTVVTPFCSVANYGSQTASYTVRMRIGAAYNQAVTVTSHSSGTARLATFPAWTASPCGDLAVSCSTELSGDAVPSNDKKSGSVSVRVDQPDGWESLSAVPLAPSGASVKDGGWLAYVESDGLIHGAKGNKTGDCYKYDLSADTWLSAAPIPEGKEGRQPSKGAVGCTDGSGSIYATKGNSTQGFWKYDIAPDSWRQLADVPLGLTNKKVQGGTDAVYANGFVYLLKGYRNEFWRYDVAADSWQSLADAPLGTSGRKKYDKGSWLVYDNDHTIYAHKARYHELFSYDITLASWTSGQLTGMPFVGMSGKSKQSRDGGCAAFLDGHIYALKGGNTQEFWRYDPSEDAWSELDTIPQAGTGAQKRRVKAGADLTATGDALYALKGNKTSEVWRYVPRAELGRQGSGDREGVAARSAVHSRQVAVLPNPARAGVLTLTAPSLRLASGPVRVEVTDVSGRVLKSQAAGRRSQIRLDLRAMKAGVYLVKLSAGDLAVTRKLVIQ